jgi:outer membrane protein
MKNISTILSSISLVLVAVLFVLYFSSGKANSSSVINSKHDTGMVASGDFKIGYFEMDSLDSKYELVKDVQAQLNKKQDAMTFELNQMEKTYRDKYNEYQAKAQAGTLSQTQSDQASKELMGMQQEMNAKKQSLDQEYQNLYVKLKTDIQKKVEDYLKDFNKSKNYSYIFANESGLFYYRDTAYNITDELVKGLNELYRKEKKD